MDCGRRLSLWHHARDPLFLVLAPSLSLRLGAGGRERIPARYCGLPFRPSGPGILADPNPFPGGFYRREPGEEALKQEGAGKARRSEEAGNPRGIWGPKNKTAATVLKYARRAAGSVPCRPAWPAWRSTDELGGRPLGSYVGGGRIATVAAWAGNFELQFIAGHRAGVRDHRSVTAHVHGGLEGNVVARHCAFGDRGVHGGAVRAWPGTVAHQFPALGFQGEGHFGGGFTLAAGLFIDPLAVDIRSEERRVGKECR